MTATHPPDEDLVAAAKAGRAAIAALIGRHQNIVFKLVGDMHLPSQVDRDDLVQHGLLALARAAEKWEPGRGTKFSSYAWTCVWNALRREAGVETRATEKLHISIGDDGADEPPAREPLELDAGMRERVESLPVLYRTVASLHFGLDGEPMDWGEIATSVCLSIPQAKRALDMAVAKMRLDAHPLSLQGE